jgi:hypothetical protein
MLRETCSVADGGAAGRRRRPIDCSDALRDLLGERPAPHRVRGPVPDSVPDRLRGPISHRVLGTILDRVLGTILDRVLGTILDRVLGTISDCVLSTTQWASASGLTPSGRLCSVP